MITYPVSPEARFNLYRISTGEIIKRTIAWPRSDGMQIVGLDPDLVYLEITEQLRPDYDPRYYVLVTTETPNVANESWDITYNTQKRPVEEITRAAENVEAAIREAILPQDKVNLYLLLAVATLFRRVEGLTLTNKENVLKDRVVSMAIKVWSNRDAFDTKVTQIEANQEPDLDTYPEAP